MDKKVDRFFELHKTDQGIQILLMHSRTEGEFGTILNVCSAELNGQFISARCVDTAEPDAGFTFRLQELAYFVANILPLFNPINSFNYGPLPLPSLQPSQDK